MSVRIAILAALIVAAHTANAESTQCTPINAVPATLSATGSYCLTNDVTSTATGTAAAITIAADDVLLDLNGHSVTGPGGSSAGIGIYSIAHRSVRVRNGVVRGFSYGVQLTDTYSYIPPFPAQWDPKLGIHVT